MATDLTIRRATEADSPQLAALHVASWLDSYRGIMPDALLDQLNTEEGEERWRKRFVKQVAETHVAVAASRVVGFVRVGPNGGKDRPESGDLKGLYVSTDRIGTGLGYRLHALGLDVLKRAGHRDAVCWCLEGNQRAIAFYERNGWTEQPGVVVKRLRGFDLPHLPFTRQL